MFVSSRTASHSADEECLNRASKTAQSQRAFPLRLIKNELFEKRVRAISSTTLFISISTCLKCLFNLNAFTVRRSRSSRTAWEKGFSLGGAYVAIGWCRVSHELIWKKQIFR